MSDSYRCPTCGDAMIGKPLMCAEHGEPSTSPTPPDAEQIARKAAREIVDAPWAQFFMGWDKVRDRDRAMRQVELHFARHIAPLVAHRDRLAEWAKDQDDTFEQINQALDSVGIEFHHNGTYAGCIKHLAAQRDSALHRAEQAEAKVAAMLQADPRQLWNVAATELKVENAELRALVADLGKLATEAVDAAGEHLHWASYADDYFQDKWNLAGDRATVERLQAELAALLARTATLSPENP